MGKKVKAKDKFPAHVISRGDEHEILKLYGSGANTVLRSTIISIGSQKNERLDAKRHQRFEEDYPEMG